VAKNKIFSQVQGLRPGRSVFDLSYAKKMSGRMGYLYPMMCDEVVPGDVFDIGAEAVVRFAPMVAPILHEIVLKADWFFVPYRIMQDRDMDSANHTTWESFITGGTDGLSNVAVPRIALNGNTFNSEGQLCDHLGFTPGITTSGNDSPVAWPVYAYNTIYNEYYRDPNLESPVDITTQLGLMYCNWDADYFTRSLPWQQRGTAPALPVSGLTNAEWSLSQFKDNQSGAVDMQIDPNGNWFSVPSATPADTDQQALWNSNVVDLSNATSVNIAELRTAVQLQKWLERNARSGYRYTEFLKAHFGVAPRDERLDRPEYIGGIRQPIVISEVLQTSETDTTPQGNLAGHGIMAGRHRVGRYHVKEYGLVMCLMSISPRPAYQQGINRQWLRVSRYDYYHPEFANLAEQAIVQEEIYAESTAGGTNQAIFGYQGRYDEMRCKHDMVAGAFRSSLDYWHLGRIFSSAPSLSDTFGHVDPTTVTRVFAAPDSDHLYVHWGNAIKAIRPLPPQSNPGRMDHDYGGY